MGKLSAFLGLVCIAAGSSYVIGQPSKTAPDDSPRVVVKNAGVETELYTDGSFALVIGNRSYQSWPELPGTEEDVMAVADALKSQGFTVETGLNLRSKELDDRVTKFLSDYGFKKDRRLLIYFAGHGDTRPTIDGRKLGYIIPVDTPSFSRDSDGFRRLAISMDTVEGWAKRIQVQHALFVFDSCFSGSLLTRAERSFPPYISLSLSQPVRQFITSGGENQTVTDNSYFRRVFVDGLRGNADLSKDGYITVQELARYLTERVSNYSGGKQAPQYGTVKEFQLDRGDMIFRVPLEVRRENEKNAAAAFNQIPLNDLDGLDRFILDYPGTSQAITAKERLDRLRAGESVSRADPEAPTLPTKIMRAVEPLNIQFTIGTYDSKGVLSKLSKTTAGIRENLGNNVKIDLVKIPAGKFKMGSNLIDEEKPVHDVSVPEVFMGATEVTQAQWKAIAKTPKLNIDLKIDPAYHLGDQLPVESITWEEAKEFCARLSRETGRKYDLPSEAEWEYAARGGSLSASGFGEKIGSDVANYDARSKADLFAVRSVAGTSRGDTVAAGSLNLTNGFGLYDMLGNVSEWCLDSWQPHYKDVPSDGSSRENNTNRRVVRGGNWSSLPVDVTVTRRLQQQQDDRYAKTGFRIVLRSPLPK